MNQRDSVHLPEGIRLQKILATAGVGSRRVCEDLIAAGQVTVNGQRVTELGTRIDPQNAIIHVRGMRVFLDENNVTLILNKPRGVITAMSDPQGRPTIAEFMTEKIPGVSHVGRLDADSEGLLILTNDGDLAHRLTHPRYEVTKRYLVHVQGRIKPEKVSTLRTGVTLEDGQASFTAIRVVDQLADQTMLEVELHEGRNRIVRRMFDAVEHPVIRLVRTRIGPINLGRLKPGTTRVLSKQDVASLMKVVGL